MRYRMIRFAMWLLNRAHPEGGVVWWGGTEETPWTLTIQTGDKPPVHLSRTMYGTMTVPNEKLRAAVLRMLHDLALRPRPA